MVEIVGVDRIHRLDTSRQELVQNLVGQFIVGLGEHLAGALVDSFLGQHLACQELARHGHLLQAGCLHGLDVAHGDATVGLDDDGAVVVQQVEIQGLATQAIGHEAHAHAVLADAERIALEEQVENFARGVAQGAQQHRRGNLAAAIYPDVDVILRVELEVEPGTTVGDDPGREQQLAGAVGLATVVVEEHAGRTMQLRDDDPFGAVDDKGAVLGHERQLAHVHFLLLDVLDGLLGAGLLVVDDQAHLHPQRCRVGDAAHLALLHIEYRCTQPVADVLEDRVAGVALDWKHGLECRVQSEVMTMVCLAILLQEFPVRLDLGRKEVWDFEHRLLLAEVLADPFLLREGICHQTPLGRTGAGRARAGNNELTPGQVWFRPAGAHARRHPGPDRPRVALRVFIRCGTIT